CRCVVARVVSPAGVQVSVQAIRSAPDDHFAAGPDRRVIASATGRVGGAGGCPAIRAGIVSAARVKREAITSKSAPDDHFAAIPNRGVSGSGVGRVGGAGGCPTVGNWIVSAAGAGGKSTWDSAPHDHATAGRYCRVKGL